MIKKSKIKYARFVIFSIIGVGGALFFFTHNNISKGSTKSGVELYVKEVLIDHLIRLGCWCDYTKFIFVVDIYNKTPEKKVFAFYPILDYCHSEVEIASVYLVVMDSMYPLVPRYSKDSIVVIEPGERREIQFRTLFKVSCLSLKSIYENYRIQLESPFWLWYYNPIDNREYVIPKSSDFTIKFYLDDTIVLPHDTIHFNMSIPGPPLGFDTINFEIKVLPEDSVFIIDDTLR